MAAYLFQRLMGRPFGPESIGAILEVRFEDRLQDQQRGHLHHAVAHRRDSQRTSASHWPLESRRVVRLKGGRFWSAAPTGWFPAIAASRFQRVDLLDRYAVHAGRALVGAHPFPCLFQHIAPIDPVVQRVKPELRFLLRLLIEFLSQQREFPGLSRFFRSGRFLQAVLLSSYITCFPRGPFAPRALPRFPATTGLSDSRPVSLHGYVFPQALGRVAALPLPGLPGSSTNLSLRAVPNHPGRPGDVPPVTSSPVSGFTIRQAGRPSLSVTRPNRV